MFDIGGPEFVFLVILALLVFGPQRLPALGRQLGGFMAQMRNALTDFKRTLDREVAAEDMKAAAEDMKQAVRNVQDLRRDAGSMARDILLGTDAPAPPPAERGAAAGDKTTDGASGDQSDKPAIDDRPGGDGDKELP